MTAHLASQIGMMAKTLMRMAREQNVTVVSTSYRNPFPPRHLVLVGAEYFHTNDTELASLRGGYSPEELDLEPIEVEDDEF